MDFPVGVPRRSEEPEIKNLSVHPRGTLDHYWNALSQRNRSSPNKLMVRSIDSPMGRHKTIKAIVQEHQRRSVDAVQAGGGAGPSTSPIAAIKALKSLKTIRPEHRPFPEATASGIDFYSAISTSGQLEHMEGQREVPDTLLHAPQQLVLPTIVYDKYMAKYDRATGVNDEVPEDSHEELAFSVHEVYGDGGEVSYIGSSEGDSGSATLDDSCSTVETPQQMDYHRSTLYKGLIEVRPSEHHRRSKHTGLCYKIGNGSFVRKGQVIRKGQIIYYNGDRKTASEVAAIPRVGSRRDYLCWLPRGEYIDSYEAHLRGECPASGANTSAGLEHIVTGIQAANNCRMLHTGGGFVALRDIYEGEELMVAYGVHYQRWSEPDTGGYEHVVVTGNAPTAAVKGTTCETEQERLPKVIDVDVSIPTTWHGVESTANADVLDTSQEAAETMVATVQAEIEDLRDLPLLDDDDDEKMVPSGPITPGESSFSFDIQGNIRDLLGVAANTRSMVLTPEVPHVFERTVSEMITQAISLRGRGYIVDFLTNLAATIAVASDSPVTAVSVPTDPIEGRPIYNPGNSNMSLGVSSEDNSSRREHAQPPQNSNDQEETGPIASGNAREHPGGELNCHCPHVDSWVEVRDEIERVPGRINQIFDKFGSYMLKGDSLTRDQTAALIAEKIGEFRSLVRQWQADQDEWIATECVGYDEINSKIEEYCEPFERRLTAQARDTAIAYEKAEVADLKTEVLKARIDQLEEKLATLEARVPEPTAANPIRSDLAALERKQQHWAKTVDGLTSMILENERNIQNIGTAALPTLAAQAHENRVVFEKLISNLVRREDVTSKQPYKIRNFLAETDYLFDGAQGSAPCARPEWLDNKTHPNNTTSSPPDFSATRNAAASNPFGINRSSPDLSSNARSQNLNSSRFAASAFADNKSTFGQNKRGMDTYDSSSDFVVQKVEFANKSLPVLGELEQRHEAIAFVDAVDDFVQRYGQNPIFKDKIIESTSRLFRSSQASRNISERLEGVIWHTSETRLGLREWILSRIQVLQKLEIPGDFEKCLSFKGAVELSKLSNEEIRNESTFAAVIQHLQDIRKHINLVWNELPLGEYLTVDVNESSIIPLIKKTFRGFMPAVEVFETALESIRYGANREYNFKTSSIASTAIATEEDMENLGYGDIDGSQHFCKPHHIASFLAVLMDSIRVRQEQYQRVIRKFRDIKKMDLAYKQQHGRHLVEPNSSKTSPQDKGPDQKKGRFHSIKSGKSEVPTPTATMSVVYSIQEAWDDEAPYDLEGTEEEKIDSLIDFEQQVLSRLKPTSAFREFDDGNMHPSVSLHEIGQLLGTYEQQHILSQDTCDDYVSSLAAFALLTEPDKIATELKNVNSSEPMRATYMQKQEFDRFHNGYRPPLHRQNARPRQFGGSGTGNAASGFTPDGRRLFPRSREYVQRAYDQSGRRSTAPEVLQGVCFRDLVGMSCTECRYDPGHTRTRAARDAIFAADKRPGTPVGRPNPEM